MSQHFNVHGEAIYDNLIDFSRLALLERARRDYFIIKCVLLSNQQCREDFIGIVLLGSA